MCARSLCIFPPDAPHMNTNVVHTCSLLGTRTSIVHHTQRGDRMQDPTGIIKGTCSRAAFLLHPGLQQGTPVTLVDVAILHVRPGAAYACVVPASIAEVHSTHGGRLALGPPARPPLPAAPALSAPAQPATRTVLAEATPEPTATAATPSLCISGLPDTVPRSVSVSAAHVSQGADMSATIAVGHLPPATLGVRCAGPCASEPSSVGLARLFAGQDEDSLELEDEEAYEGVTMDEGAEVGHESAPTSGPTPAGPAMSRQMAVPPGAAREAGAMRGASIGAHTAGALAACVRGELLHNCGITTRPPDTDLPRPKMCAVVS
jgi:hypothetical protein